ncbi:Rnu3ip2 protein [Pholiota molesta]|nr:Rnu3ip2 protein [Pholiota molesta]
MPDSFFSAPKQKKRKRAESTSHGPKKFPRNAKQHGKQTTGAAPAGKGKRARDEELSDQTDEDGDVDDMDLRADDAVEDSGEEDENETPAEKRLRLAQLYLESVKVGLADGEFDVAEIDKELISARLKQDVLEHSGKVHLFIADAFDFSHPPSTILHTRGHRFSVTSAVASESGETLYTAGKEGHIIKWNLATGKKEHTFYKTRPLLIPKQQQPQRGRARAKARHTDEVLGLALSGDGKLLASAGRDKRLCVWDVQTNAWVKTFAGILGHKDAVSGVAFRKGTAQLYSASLDRTLKVYDLSPAVMGYVETLFGHQDHVLALDALRGETCVSIGARDKTVRYWKIVDETQLVFRGGGRSRDEEGEDDEGVNAAGKAKRDRKGKGKEERFVEGSLECVAMVDETTFISGEIAGDSICLWTTTKKKPIFTQALAHGLNEALSESEGVIRTPRWITSLACLRYSDLFASGSWEGDVRIWKLDAKLKSFSLIGKVSAPGVVNSLQLLALPRTFPSTISWPRPEGQPGAPMNVDVEDSETPATTETTVETARPARTGPEIAVHPFVLVAGLGQEHRLGRWLSVKEGGARNGAMVALFTPKLRTAGAS